MTLDNNFTHQNETNSFNKINSNSRLQGKIRCFNKDFLVNEIQQFTPSGEGEHVWLKILKEGENTDWVAKTLAQIAEVSRRDVSYAGMKDRNAITTQWFSVQMPGREAPNWKEGLDKLKLQSIQILEEHRHDRKLKRGALKGNQFKLTLRNFKGTEEELAESIHRIKEQGVPNYYGVQRFGHGGFNVKKAEQWFCGEFKVKDRNKRSIYLSAARSWIFNHILSARIEDGSWNSVIAGDVYILNGSNSSFHVDAEDKKAVDDIVLRLTNHDIHPSGALWGRGQLQSVEAISELEKGIVQQFSTLAKGLESHGLKQERRALRLSLKNLEYQMIDSQTVVLEFSLPQGTYATTVLSEIGEFV
ncbi:UNVERIFIED_CONTAM: hypothetical protein GTU68_003172 [Idotea baltica]|nr:hypothetical protein [Idotea baltica]